MKGVPCESGLQTDCQSTNSVFSCKEYKCLDPRNKMNDHDVSIKKFKRVLTTLENAKKVLEGDCDSLFELFRQFIMEVPSSSPSQFKDHDPNSDRLDSFLYLHMGQKRSYQSLWKVVADLLVLSHAWPSQCRKRIFSQ